MTVMAHPDDAQGHVSETWEQWREDSDGTKPAADGLVVIPVRVVDVVHTLEQPVQSLNTEQMPLGLANVPVRVSRGRPARVAVRVRNRTGVPIYIDGHDQVTVGTGYQLDAGEAETYDYNGDVWAVAATDLPGSVHTAAISRDG